MGRDQYGNPTERCTCCERTHMAEDLYYHDYTVSPDCRMYKRDVKAAFCDDCLDEMRSMVLGIIKDEEKAKKLKQELRK